MRMRRKSGIVPMLVKMHRVSRQDSARVRGSRAYIIHTGVSHVRSLATMQILAACSNQLNDIDKAIHDVGESAGKGRRGGPQVKASGSFVMSSANRAGNDEEELGGGDDEEIGHR